MTSGTSCSDKQAEVKTLKVLFLQKFGGPPFSYSWEMDAWDYDTAYYGAIFKFYYTELSD